MSKKYDNYKRPEIVVPVEDHLLPLGSTNRSGIKQNPEWIVIHEVSMGLGKSPANFNLDHYANKILEAAANGSTIGYHYLVGDKKIYQFVKDDEKTCHTGTITGNGSSIGVERLICEGVNYEEALHNQAKLVATLMVKWNISLDHVITHKQSQEIFDAANKNYRLNCYKTGVLEINNEDFLHELKNTIEISKQVLDSNSELLSIDSNKKILENFQNQLETFNKIIVIFNELTEVQKIWYMHEVMKSQKQIISLNNKINNVEEEPFNKEIKGLKFVDEHVGKNCPSRLLAGQRGGLEKFYREIEKCLKYNWLFDSVLTEDEKRSL